MPAERPAKQSERPTGQTFAAHVTAILNAIPKTKPIVNAIPDSGNSSTICRRG
jgi:hypothetical protein